MGCAIDVRLLFERLVPGAVGPLTRCPWTARERLDDLDGHIPFPADSEHLLEGFTIALVLRHEEVVRQEHRVEIEPRQTAPVHGRDGPAVTGHADEANQPLLARLDDCLQRAARTHRLVPVVRMPERVQLDQVDLIDTQPFERAMDVLAGLRRAPRSSFGRQEKILAVPCHPRADAQL